MSKAFLLLMIGLVPASAIATDVRRGETVEVRADEDIKGNVFLSGSHVIVGGTVEGDVYAAGRDIEVTGHVKGDLIGAGRVASIRGQVDGNVRFCGNTVEVPGTVGRDVTFFGDTTRIEPNGTVGGGLMMFGSNADLDGKLGRDVLFHGDHLSITGTVAGRIDEKGHSLTIGSSAQINGPIRFQGAKEADVSPQAKLAFPIEYHRLEHKQRHGAHYYIWQLIWMAAYVLFGLALFALMPGFSREAVSATERYGASFGLGVLVFFGVPIAAIVACVTVVGLFIGISAFLLWYATLYFAQAVVGALAGQRLLGRATELWPLIGRMAVGVVILRLCTGIPVVGGWVKFAVVLWGLGAISLVLYKRLSPPARSAAIS